MIVLMIIWVVLPNELTLTTQIFLAHLLIVPFLGRRISIRCLLRRLGERVRARDRSTVWAKVGVFL